MKVDVSGIEGVRSEAPGEDCGLRFWSNSCGEVLRCAEDELPADLKDDLESRWSDEGERCLLAELDGEYGLAFVTEFDDDYLSDLGFTRDEARSLMVAWAVRLRKGNPDATFIIRTDTPITKDESVDELIMFVPHAVSDERFGVLADLVAPCLWDIDMLDVPCL